MNKRRLFSLFACLVFLVALVPQRQGLVLLAQRLQSSGCKCELVIEEGLWHVYVLFKIPEAGAALEKIKVFLEQQHAENQNA